MNIMEHARKMRPVIERAAQSLDDATALTAVDLYPAWEQEGLYEAGVRVRYNGILYRCLIAHGAQPDWTPENSPSLWARVLIEDLDTVPEWVQPDSTNPYMTGDRVSHNGSIWVSAIDGNIWEPGVYGWEQE